MADRYFKKYIGVEIINNRKVKLDKKIVIYQRDRGLIMCFEIEGYDYVMVDRDGEHGEDMSGSYASVTLVNPDGREFFYDNIKVDGNTVEFMITEDMTDDLDEIGIYTLQIHINNYHQEIIVYFLFLLLIMKRFQDWEEVLKIYS